VKRLYLGQREMKGEFPFLLGNMQAGEFYGRIGWRGIRSLLGKFFFDTIP